MGGCPECMVCCGVPSVGPQSLPRLLGLLSLWGHRARLTCPTSQRPLCPWRSCAGLVGAASGAPELLTVGHGVLPAESLVLAAGLGTAGPGWPGNPPGLRPVGRRVVHRLGGRASPGGSRGDLRALPLRSRLETQHGAVGTVGSLATGVETQLALEQLLLSAGVVPCRRAGDRWERCHFPERGCRGSGSRRQAVLPTRP